MKKEARKKAAAKREYLRNTKEIRMNENCKKKRQEKKFR
jgi:hypothetical protein